MPQAAAAATRQLIVETADRLMGQYGYNRMTIEELARECGIGKGSVYLHFRSKEQIALATVDRVVDAAHDEMARIAGEDRPAVERLREMLQARVRVRLERVRHRAWSMDEMLARIRPALLERRRVHFDREAKLLAIVISEGERRGEIPHHDPALAARALLTGTNSLLPFGLSRRDIDELERVQHDVALVTRFLLLGLTNNSPDR